MSEISFCSRLSTRSLGLHIAGALEVFVEWFIGLGEKPDFVF